MPIRQWKLSFSVCGGGGRAAAIMLKRFERKFWALLGVPLEPCLRGPGSAPRDIGNVSWDVSVVFVERPSFDAYWVERSAMLADSDSGSDVSANLVPLNGPWKYGSGWCYIGINSTGCGYWECENERLNVHEAFFRRHSKIWELAGFVSWAMGEEYMQEVFLNVAIGYEMNHFRAFNDLPNAERVMVEDLLWGDVGEDGGVSAWSNDRDKFSD